MKYDSINLNSPYNLFTGDKPKKRTIQKSEDVSEKNIGILSEALDGATDFRDAKRIIGIAAGNDYIEKINETTYKTGKYVLKTFLRVSGEGQAKSLEKLTKQNISIAPKLVYTRNYGDYTIIITQIDGLEEGGLVPFSQGYKLLSDGAKQDAYRDVQKVLKMGYVNQAMLYGDSNWYITPKSKKIMVVDWKPLRSVREGESIELLNDMYKTIFNK